MSIRKKGKFSQDDVETFAREYGRDSLALVNPKQQVEIKRSEEVTRKSGLLKSGKPVISLYIHNYFAEGHDCFPELKSGTKINLMILQQMP